jgi:hypothetical protein
LACNFGLNASKRHSLIHQHGVLRVVGYGLQFGLGERRSLDFHAGNTRRNDNRWTPSSGCLDCLCYVGIGSEEASQLINVLRWQPAMILENRHHNL